MDLNKMRMTICQSINIKEFLDMEGIAYKESNKYINGKSLFDPANNENCFYCYRQIGKNRDYQIPEYLRNIEFSWYKDPKVNKSGDVVRLNALLNHEGSDFKSMLDLIERKKITGILMDKEENTRYKRYTHILKDYISKCHKELLTRSDLIERVKNRGASLEWIKQKLIGFDSKKNRIVYPMRNISNDLVSYSLWNYLYNQDNNNSFGPKYQRQELDEFDNLGEGFNNVLLGSETLLQNRSKNILVITEGVWDHDSIDQSDYHCLCTHGTPSADEIDFIVETAKNHDYDDIVLCFDNDDSGKKFAKSVGIPLYEANIRFKVGCITDKYKDVNEQFTMTGEIDSIIKNAKPGLALLASEYINNLAQLQNFILRTALFYYQSEVSEMISLLQSDYNLDFEVAKELKSLAKKRPTDKIIIDEVLNRYDLLYAKRLGFYIYKNGIWKAIDDEQVEALIKKIFEVWKEGSRLSNLRKLLRAEVIKDVEFNKKQVLVFNNGTLEIETGKLREFRKEDYSTVKLNYDYDPGAKCPTWETFLDDVLESDLTRIQLLKEYCGYVLQPSNNKGRAIMFFLGEGSNGKSVIFDVLEEAFGGEGNVTSISAAKLKKSDYLIELKNSIVNFSREAKKEFYGAEENIKAIASGDTLTGRMLYQKPVSFKTRCKLFISCNNDIKFNDQSNAFTDRMIFIKFNKTYSTNGFKILEGANKADTTLTDRLLKELPGIFNWLYEGYKYLKGNDFAFSFNQETMDQRKLIDHDNNPIKMFVDEVLLPLLDEESEKGNSAVGDILRKDIVFKEWHDFVAIENLSIQYKSNTAIFTQVKKAIRNLRPGQWREVRTNQERTLVRVKNTVFVK